MDGRSEAQPTLEALEEERRRLKQLERNLAAERDRVQAAAAKEIARMQDVLREAAGRAARRERELESARKRFERKIGGGRFGLLGRLLGRRRPGTAATPDLERALDEREARLEERERALSALAGQASAEAARLRELEASLRESRGAVEQSEALEARARELAQREAELRRKVDELVDAERRSVEQLAARGAALEQREAVLYVDQHVRVGADPLADRATVLDEQEADLAETITALEERERELAVLRHGLEEERSRLAGRWQRLAEAERTAPARTGSRPRVGFGEGLRDLARKRGAH